VESSASQHYVSKHETAFHIADKPHLVQPVDPTFHVFRYGAVATASRFG
jgi:hypothetical protein